MCIRDRCRKFGEVRPIWFLRYASGPTDRHTHSSQYFAPLPGANYWHSQICNIGRVARCLRIHKLGLHRQFHHIKICKAAGEQLWISWLLTSTCMVQQLKCGAYRYTCTYLSTKMCQCLLTLLLLRWMPMWLAMLWSAMFGIIRIKSGALLAVRPELRRVVFVTVHCMAASCLSVNRPKLHTVHPKQIRPSVFTCVFNH